MYEQTQTLYNLGILVQVTDVAVDPGSRWPSFKKVLIQDRCSSLLQSHNLLPSIFESWESNTSGEGPNSGLRFDFTEDNVHIFNTRHLFDVSQFEQFYLIGKVLGQSMSLKLILSTCILDCKLIGEVNFVDMENGFSLVKLTNALDCNWVLEGLALFSWWVYL